MRKILLNWLLVCLAALPVMAQQALEKHYKLIEDISYIDPAETDDYRRERCRLDLYYPADETDFPTVVWFHGGGLETGNKYIPEELKNAGVAVAAVNYRLSPKAQNPAYLEDAAEALAWTFSEIEKQGGNPESIYVSGHSAGGYLTLMLALDSTWLAPYGIGPDQVKAYFPISGQTLTHYTIRKERGVPMQLPVIDAYAPVQWLRSETSPIRLISGDRNLELTGRYEENALLDALLRGAGNTNTKLIELQGFDHGNVVQPGCILLLDYIRRQEKN